MWAGPDRRPVQRQAQTTQEQQPARRNNSYCCVVVRIIVLVHLVAILLSIILAYYLNLGVSQNDRDTIHAITSDDTIETIVDYSEYLVYRAKARTMLEEIDVLTEDEKEYKLLLYNADMYSKAHLTFDALQRYSQVLEKLPYSFRANYGSGKVYEWKAYNSNKRKSRTENLLIAALYYIHAFHCIHSGVRKGFKEILGLRIVDIYEDIGHPKGPSKIITELIADHPDEPYYVDRLAKTYIRRRRYTDAVHKYKELLKRWPEYGDALVEYGRLMHLQRKWKDAVIHLSKGITADYPHTNQGVYFEALGDSLQRLGRRSEAIRNYEYAVAKRFFRSVYQRSYHNVDHLTGKPWWSVEEMTIPTTYRDENGELKIITEKDFYRKLQSMSSILKQEAQDALTKPFATHYIRDNIEYYPYYYEPNLVQEVLVIHRGLKTSTSRSCPKLRHLFETFLPTRRCRLCNVKYVTINQGHIWPTCGSTNTILTTHLALSVPNDVSIKVGNETRTWTEGDALIFDASFEHEIWNNGTGVLTLLSFEMWHPELKLEEMQELNNRY